MHSLKTAFAFSAVIVLSSGLLGWAADPNVHLQFGADGKFKIAQFTDIHWEILHGGNNEKSLDAMASVLDIENPDMVVLTGDIVPEWSGLASSWESVVEVMQDRNIPWAVTLGNHDTESIFMSPEETISLLSGLPYSLVEAGPGDIGGIGNYVLGVKDSSGQHNAAAIYCLDSQEDGMAIAQVQWYRDQSAAMTQSNGGGVVDDKDASILAVNWHRGQEETAPAVPEPSTLVMLMAATAMVCLAACQRYCA